MRKRRKSLCALLVGIVAASHGCWQDPTPPPSSRPSFAGITLTVGALDEPGLLEGVNSQRGEWVASRGGQVEIRPKPITVESAGEVDVLLFPGSRLGDLVDAGRLEPIPNEAVMPPDPRRKGRPGKSDSPEQSTLRGRGPLRLHGDRARLSRPGDALRQ